VAPNTAELREAVYRMYCRELLKAGEPEAQEARETNA
jgi:hypothetical protein